MGVEGISDYAENLIRFKARKLARTAASPEVDWEDFAQDMRLDLWRRLSKFDPSRASFRTFVDRVVKHKVASIIEARKAGLRDYRRQQWSLNDPLKTPDGRRAERGDMLDQDTTLLRTGGANRPAGERIDLRDDIRTVLAGLPPELRGLAAT